MLSFSHGLCESFRKTIVEALEKFDLLPIGVTLLTALVFVIVDLLTDVLRECWIRGYGYKAAAFA